MLRDCCCLWMDLLRNKLNNIPVHALFVLYCPAVVSTSPVFCLMPSLFLLFFPFLGVRLVYWSLWCTATFVICFHLSLLLAFSLHFSSSSAFLRSLFTHSSHLSCGLPRFLQPSCFHSVVDVPRVNFEQTHAGRRVFCQVFLGLPRPAVRSHPLHHQPSTCLHTIGIILSFHMFMPPQSASSHHIPNFLYTQASSQFSVGPSFFLGNTTHPPDHPQLCPFHLWLQLCPHGPWLASIQQCLPYTWPFSRMVLLTCFTRVIFCK